MNLLERLAALSEYRDEHNQVFQGPFVTERLFDECVSLIDKVYFSVIKAYLEAHSQPRAPDWILSNEERELLNLNLGTALINIRTKVKYKKP
jgi:hypothetical protein